jgi:hypothetical protein
MRRANKDGEAKNIKVASHFAEAEAVQIVYELRQDEYRAPVPILVAANWLKDLSA